MTGIIAALAGGAADTAASLSNVSVGAGGSIGAQTASFEIRNNRTAYSVTTTLGPSYNYDWLASYADPANYEVRATVQDGTLTSGPVGSWLNTSTTRAWSVTDIAPDATPVECTLLIEVRNALTTIVLDSCNVTLTAERA